MAKLAIVASQQSLSCWESAGESRISHRRRISADALTGGTAEGTGALCRQQPLDAWPMTPARRASRPVRRAPAPTRLRRTGVGPLQSTAGAGHRHSPPDVVGCLLYTSDAADDLL